MYPSSAFRRVVAVEWLQCGWTTCAGTLSMHLRRRNDLFTLMFHQLTNAGLFKPNSSLYHRIRVFNSSAVSQGKRRKKAATSKTSKSSKPLRPAKDKISDKLQLIADNHLKQAGWGKKGHTSSRGSDLLQVNKGGDVPHNAIAHTTITGRNFIMSIFDPAHVSRVIKTALDSKKDFAAVADPKNTLGTKALAPLDTPISKGKISESSNAVPSRPDGSQGDSNNKPTALGAFKAQVKIEVASENPTSCQQAVLDSCQRAVLDSTKQALGNPWTVSMNFSNLPQRLGRSTPIGAAALRR